MVLAVALLAGCAAAVEPVQTISLPLDEYRLSPAEAGRVARAHRRLLAQCMEPFGLTVPEPASAQGETMGLNERRYGITNATHASDSGYRLPRPPGEPTARAMPSPHPDLTDVMSGRGERVIHGNTVPEGGCYGEARRRLHAHAPEAPDMFVAQRLDMDSLRVSKEDEMVQAAVARWSRCMRDKGYDYADPFRAAGDPAFRGPVTPYEIETALADIACKDGTDLVRVWSAVETRRQRPVIEQHRAALEAIRRAHDSELAVASELGI